jgi:hypothetical protein
MDLKLTDRCEKKLVEIAKKRGTISYSELAAHLGVASQGVGPYLNAIYSDAVMSRGLPDLTLLAVYRGTNYGRFHSRGLPTQSVVFDPSNPEHRRIYDRDRERVYKQWG